ncbi:hypothetical protein Pelo_15279 [Pelomyxa schiedti]|nr:hypothetical protein Pelo_15279 [Pelomyxa schiedti]
MSTVDNPPLSAYADDTPIPPPPSDNVPPPTEPPPSFDEARTPTPPPNPTPKLDYGRRAQQGARELIMSERTFVSQMSKHRLYALVAKRLLTPDEYTTVFKSMAALSEAHGRLAEQFSGIPEETIVPDLLAVFQQWMKTADLYNLYMSVGESYACGSKILSNLKANNPKWAKFVETLDYSAAVGGVNLECLLKIQVCRIPRYMLIFQDMKRSISFPCPEIDTIITALKEIGDFFHKALQAHERIREALDLAPKLVNYKGVWPPKRELLMRLESILPKTSRKSTAFLMSDLLLACTNARTKALIPCPGGGGTTSEPAHYDVVIQLQYSEGLYEVYHGPVRKHPDPKEPGKWWAPVCIRRTADTPTSTTASGTATGKGTGTDTGTGNKGTRAGSVGLLRPPAAAAVLQLVDFRGENITRFVESLARLRYQSFDWRGSAAAFVACSLPRVGARCPAAASLNSFCLSEIAHCLFDFRALKSPFEVHEDDPLLL